MSSVHCEKCGKMIWDKYTSFEKGCYEKQVNDDVFSHCGFCGFEKNLTLN